MALSWWSTLLLALACAQILWAANAELQGSNPRGALSARTGPRESQAFVYQGHHPLKVPLVDVVSEHGEGEDGGHDSGNHTEHVGVHLVSWRWDHMGLYITITVFIIFSGLAKVGEFTPWGDFSRARSEPIVLPDGSGVKSKRSLDDLLYCTYYYACSPRSIPPPAHYLVAHSGVMVSKSVQEAL